MKKVFVVLCLTLTSHIAFADSQLHWAVRQSKGKVGEIEKLIEDGFDVNAKDHTGNTAFTWAVEYGHRDVVSLLLDHGADISVRNRHGETSLISAAVNGHQDVIRLLIKHGADVRARDNEGRTALLSASRSGYPEGFVDSYAISLLLEHGADVNAKDKSGVTPLMWVSFHGHYRMISLLLEKGADINARDKNGNTALMWNLPIDAPEFKLLFPGNLNPYQVHSLHRLQVMSLLLSQTGVDVNARDNEGKTVLQRAREEGKLDMVSLLLKHGAREFDGKGACRQVVR